MRARNQQPKRRYDARKRQAAATRRREQIVHAAKASFEERGWGGTTIGRVAAAAGVSAKTIEAVFGTKAALLRAAVDYAIRGDVEPVAMPQRDAVAAMERAGTAVDFLELHAAHVRRVNERSARIALAVEHAAGTDAAVASLWQTMNANRSFAVGWATDTLLARPGVRPRLERADVEAIFWVALDWGTFRTLTEHAGLTADAFEAWVRRLYEATFLPGQP